MLSRQCVLDLIMNDNHCATTHTANARDRNEEEGEGQEPYAHTQSYWVECMFNTNACHIGVETKAKFLHNFHINAMRDRFVAHKTPIDWAVGLGCGYTTWAWSGSLDCFYANDFFPFLSAYGSVQLHSHARISPGKVMISAWLSLVYCRRNLPHPRTLARMGDEKSKQISH